MGAIDLVLRKLIRLHCVPTEDAYSEPSAVTVEEQQQCAAYAQVYDQLRELDESERAHDRLVSIREVVERR